MHFWLYTFHMVDYQEIIESSRRRLVGTMTGFIRSINDDIDWTGRLVGIRGPRGTGKTTLLLQRMKTVYAEETLSGRALYASLDNLWFANQTLPAFVDSFVKNGGTRLFLDEVHKYPDWARVLKNVYDDYPELSVVFTGSSLLEILNARSDLSRRAVMYTMQGLSFREYLELCTHHSFPRYSLEQILADAPAISTEVVSQIKPLAYFGQYLQTGYYPYFTESLNTYPIKLEETVNMILEVELPLLRNVETAYVPKLRQLLGIIAESAPFLPNVSKIAGTIGINRQTLLSYLAYLNDAKLTRSLYRDARGISSMQKPDKLYLENTNLMYLFKGNMAETGTVRETFLANQLSFCHLTEFSDASDFFVDRKWTIESGGKNKTGEQIKNVPDAYVAAADIEYGAGSKIPLWLFGFMY